LNPDELSADWTDSEGHGYTIQLEVVPINGRIVLRQPIEDPATPAIETEKGSESALSMRDSSTKL
jgi:hypothetical protein